MAKSYLFLFISFAFVNTNIAQGWSELGTGANALGANNTILTICTDTLDNVFAGGRFTSGSSNYIAYFDGNWSNLWNSSFNGAINSICFSPISGPYAGGQFMDDNNKYYVSSELVTGTSPNFTRQWQKLASLNANGQILTLTINPLNELLAAGDFTDAEGLPYVAQGPGNIINAWIPRGDDHFDSLSAIYALCYDASSNAYAAGTFHDTTNVFADSGSSWVGMGLNANGPVYTICSANGNIYAAGNFTDAAGYNYVAVYSNNTWSELSGSSAEDSLKANGQILSICADDKGNIYAAGSFTNTGGKHYVAEWNGASWSELGGTNALNANATIYAICADSKNNIYAAGDFTDGNAYRYVSKYTSVNTGLVSETIASANIKIYPSPAINVLNIEYTGQPDNIHYTIFDMIGNALHTGILNSNYTSVDIGILAAGMYLVQINEAKSQTFKVVKGEF